MDYVDLLYCHRPDMSTPIEETVRAMNWVIDHGYAFYWGTSEWTAQQITQAWEVAHRLDLIGPAMEQPEYNLLTRDKVFFLLHCVRKLHNIVLLRHCVCLGSLGCVQLNYVVCRNSL
jgi:aryl-alcohol dehydrogenase-like predicted oxidoreductase